jgi:hypothetical protein
MDYMFLLYADEQMTAQLSEEEMARRLKIHRAIVRDAVARGIYKGASPLRPTSQSVTVRRDGGALKFTDGPFIETKEALGGYYLLDCKDLEEAKYWAGRIAQTNCVNTIEIRALREVNLLGEPESEAAVVANA